jgi:ribosomal protein S18 acetylase RimI-like enzyme
MRITSARTGFMEVRIHPWKDVNVEELARFSFQTRYKEGFPIGNITVDTYLTAIQWWINQSKSIPIIAYTNGQIAGWLVFFSFIPTTATIGRWHPIVKQVTKKDEIAMELLRASISHARAQSFEHLEAELTGITPETESWYQSYANWYESLGFYLSTEEARWEKDLKEDSFPAPVVSPELQLLPLDQFTNEDLEAPFFEMFNNSQDRFWLDQTPDQRRESFNFWFNRERPFVEEASGVLLRGDEVVGLTVVRPIQGAAMLGPIAVAPPYRQKGLGRTLMAHSFHGVRLRGIAKIQLEFDITNQPALKFYRRLGFKHIHRLAIFRLNLSSLSLK